MKNNRVSSTYMYGAPKINVPDIPLSIIELVVNIASILRDVTCGNTATRGGGYQVNFLRSVIFQIFRLTKTLVACMIARSCLTGVTAAGLWRHLANMNVIESI